jgi:3',5'-cyclic AMP phosphodiesterase CpdA
MVKKAFCLNVLRAAAGLVGLLTALLTALVTALAPTPAQAAARVTKGPFLQALGPTGVTIKIEIDEPAAVNVRVEGARGETREAQSLEAKQFHAVRVEGLTPSSTYRYRVFVTGSAGDETDEGRFTTAPDPQKESPPFRFIAYGDSRSDHAAHAAVVRSMEAVPSDFLVHTGDMVATGSKDLEWRTFFGIERALLRDRCVFAAVGNHELTTPDPSGKLAFLRYFAGPSPEGGGELSTLYSSFRWSNTRFFLLNAMDTWTGDDRRWLAEELARSAEEPGLTHRIAVLHHGPFSSGPHGNNAKIHASGALERMRKAGVGLILAGHDHVYERGESDGLKFIITGGAGAPLYARKRVSTETRVFESVHHFVEVSVDGEAVTTTAHRASGGVLDKCGFRGRGGWDCSDQGSGRAAAVGAAGAVQQASGCGCEVPGSGSGGGNQGLSAAAGLAVGLAAAARRRARGPVSRARSGTFGRKNAREA